MALDVETPPPPSLSAGESVDDYEDVTVDAAADLRRDELAAFLEDGAWEEAFQRWAAETSLSEAAFAVVRDLDLLAEFDFFWDDFADRVGYHAPGLPEDWQERDLHPDLESWSTVSSINASLTELGRTVSDHLREEYVDWEADYEEPDDLPDF